MFREPPVFRGFTAMLQGDGLKVAQLGDCFNVNVNRLSGGNRGVILQSVRRGGVEYTFQVFVDDRVEDIVVGLGRLAEILLQILVIGGQHVFENDKAIFLDFKGGHIALMEKVHALNQHLRVAAMRQNDGEFATGRQADRVMHNGIDRAKRARLGNDHFTLKGRGRGTGNMHFENEGRHELRGPDSTGIHTANGLGVSFAEIDHQIGCVSRVTFILVHQVKVCAGNIIKDFSVQFANDTGDIGGGKGAAKFQHDLVDGHTERNFATGHARRDDVKKRGKFLRNHRM